VALCIVRFRLLESTACRVTRSNFEAPLFDWAHGQAFERTSVPLLNSRYHPRHPCLSPSLNDVSTIGVRLFVLCFCYRRVDALLFYSEGTRWTRCGVCLSSMCLDYISSPLILVFCSTSSVILSSPSWTATPSAVNAQFTTRAAVGCPHAPRCEYHSLPRCNYATLNCLALFQNFGQQIERDIDRADDHCWVCRAAQERAACR
jgi:hypothetical protein